MNKFKVGDKVRRITEPNADRHGHRIEVGEVCEVAGVDYVTGWLTVTKDFVGSSNPMFFELVVEPTPTARSTDPASSKGKRRVNKYEEAVLRYLIAHGQGTGKDIAAVEQVPLNCVTPRFAPLRRRNLIKDTGVRKDKQIVWGLV